MRKLPRWASTATSECKLHICAQITVARPRQAYNNQRGQKTTRKISLVWGNRELRHRIKIISGVAVLILPIFMVRSLFDVDRPPTPGEGILMGIAYGMLLTLFMLSFEPVLQRVRRRRKK